MGLHGEIVVEVIAIRGKEIRRVKIRIAAVNVFDLKFFHYHRITFCCEAMVVLQAEEERIIVFKFSRSEYRAVRRPG